MTAWAATAETRTDMDETIGPRPVIGRAFSHEVIDAEAAIPIEEHLLPWVKRDIESTLSDEVPKAERSMKRAKADLDVVVTKLGRAKVGTADHRLLTEEVDFLQTMYDANRLRLEFCEGKVHLLKRRLAISGAP